MWSYRRKIERSVRATGSRGIASAAAAAAGLEWGGEALGRTGEREKARWACIGRDWGVLEIGSEGCC